MLENFSGHVTICFGWRSVQSGLGFIREEVVVFSIDLKDACIQIYIHPYSLPYPSVHGALFRSFDSYTGLQ